MTAQVAADLRTAAVVLRHDGWGRGVFNNKQTGCHCVAGAIPGVNRGTRQWREAVDFFGRHIGVGSNPILVYRWNDDPERTADEVIDALFAAADAADAAEAGL